VLLLLRRLDSVAKRVDFLSSWTRVVFTLWAMEIGCPRKWVFVIPRKSDFFNIFITIAEFLVKYFAKFRLKYYTSFRKKYYIH
jgi:hypothetical protein